MRMETHRKDRPHPEMTSRPPSPLKYDVGKNQRHRIRLKLVGPTR